MALPATVFMSLLSQNRNRNWNFWKLGTLSLCTGAVVMSVEIVVSRILTPVFGNSTYTWGSLIGIILSGLSLGYFIGGRLADKQPDFQKFCSIILSAGMYIVFIPFIAPSIMEFTTSSFPHGPHQPFLAAFFILMMPTTLLGFVSPYAVKLGTHTLKKVGNISGSLYSLSTLGSIFGTFLAAFFLIPQFEITQIILSLGVVLILVSTIGLRLRSRIVGGITITVLLVSSFLPAGDIFPHASNVIYEKDTPYSHVDITDAGNTRTLYLDGIVHSRMNLEDPEKLVIDYTRYFHLAQVFNPQIKQVLFVGGGGFSGPKSFLDTYKAASVDVVEIDSHVIEIAEKYFEVNYSNPRLDAINSDARNYLQEHPQEYYDAIILDAYATDYVPFHLMTQEFYQLLSSRLSENGVVISNLVGTLSGEKSKIIRSSYKTMETVFPSMYIFETEQNNSTQNIILVGTKTRTDFDKEKMLQYAQDGGAEILLQKTMFPDSLYSGKLNTGDVPVLTDNFSPVQSFVNPLTGQPFSENKIGYKSSSSNFLEQNNSLLTAILAMITLYWAYDLKKIWKRHNEDIQ